MRVPQMEPHSVCQANGESSGRLLIVLCGVLLISLFMQGCAFVRGNYGDQFNPSDVESIKKGSTTRMDVADRLGAPDRILEINAHEVFQYYNYDVKSGTVLFFSRTNVKSNDLYLFFDNNGVVEEVIFGKQKTPPKFQFWPFGK
jgi:hypothetical protein